MSVEQEIAENYFNQAKAAQFLGITTSRVNLLCREGRFQGAFKAGWSWLIPKIAVENFSRQKRGRKRKINSDRILLESAIEASNQSRMKYTDA